MGSANGFYERKAEMRMSREEAEQLTSAVRRDAEALWQKLLRLYEGNAHSAMGYQSWAAYFQAEFGKGRAQAYRLLAAARVSQVVGLHVETRGMTEAQARVLGAVVDNEKRLGEIAAEVKRRGGWRRISARELKQIAFGPLATANVAADEPLMLGKRLGDLQRQVMAEIRFLRARAPEVRDQIRQVDPETRRRSVMAIQAFRHELDFIEDVFAAGDH